MKKFEPRTKDLEQVELNKLKSLFPECFSEGKLNLDKLLTIIGEEHILDDFEKYEFRWKGKSEALLVSQQRSMGTLRPAPDESLNWDTTKNLYIEGDNLEVMRLMIKSYHMKVKMIYIDPPYNTGRDFVYKDDWTDSLGNYKMITEQGAASNPETSGRYHTDWLNMMYPRIRMAKHLLRNDGVIFVSIDDNEVHNLRKVMDEVFGEDNFVCQFIWKSKLGKVGTTSTVSVLHEYILCYAKQSDKMSFKMIERDNEGRRENLRQWGQADRRVDRPSMWYPITIDGMEVYPFKDDGTEGRWRVGREMATELLEKGLLELVQKGDKYHIIRNFEPGTSIIPYDTLLLDDIGTTAKGSLILKELDLNKVFDYSKPIELVKHFAMLCTTDNDIILDFFSGSATAAHAVMQLNAEDNGNRRFIMIQLPEKCSTDSEAFKAGYKNICEIGKERIRRAGAKILAEHKEKQSQSLLGEGEGPKPLGTPPDTGFRVFKLDTSNIKRWDTSGFAKPTQEEINLLYQRLNNMVDSVKPDRTELDIVFEIMAKHGVDLCETVMPLEFKLELDDGNSTITAYAIAITEDGTPLFMVCLSHGVTTEHAELMAEYEPGLIVFGDKSFADSIVLANVDHALKNLGVDILLI